MKSKKPSVSAEFFHNFVEGYTTDKGLLIDLDQTLIDEVLNIANRLMKKYSLEGYLLLETSPLSHALIFNKKLRWKKVLEILFKLVWKYHYYQHQEKPKLTRWAMLQALKGSCTIRISGKTQKSRPKILMQIGRTDKIIKEYLDIYKGCNNVVF